MCTIFGIQQCVVLNMPINFHFRKLLNAKWHHVPRVKDNNLKKAAFLSLFTVTSMSQSVSLSVCTRGYLRNHTRDHYQSFCACCLSPWLGPPPTSDMFTIGRIAYRREGVFFPLNALSAGKGGWECTARTKYICYLRLPCCFLTSVQNVIKNRTHRHHSFT